MSNEGEVLKLVGMTYDAALDEQKWPTFLEAFAHATGSSSSYLRSTDLTSKVNYFVSIGYDPAMKKSYADHFIKLDYYSQFFYKTAPVNSVGHEQMTAKVGLSPAEQRKTEYFNDYLVRLGSHEHAMAVVLEREGNRTVQFAVQRGKRVGGYGERKCN